MVYTVRDSNRTAPEKRVGGREKERKGKRQKGKENSLGAHLFN